ncbi:hypothetical protein ACHAP5_006757 [Fusarium lateritium]
MEVIGKIAEVTADLLKDAEADQATTERQNQIMSALGKIQDTLQKLQVAQEESTNIERISPSFTLISTWQKEFPVAVKDNNTADISSYLQTFNSKGEDGAAYHIQNIFNVLTGRGLGSGTNQETTPMLQSWQLQSYQKMYAPVNGQYTFTLKNYLDDYDKTISWALGMAGYALVCQIIALQDLAQKSTPAADISHQAKDIINGFKANTDAVLNLAYTYFPSFVQKFKPSYKEQGTKLNHWFRLWCPGLHVKNYVGWTGDGNSDGGDYSNDPTMGITYNISAMDCDSSEGIYPELEFRFDEKNHPLNGPAKLISRMDGATVSIYCYGDGNGEFSAGLTTTTDPSYWRDGMRFIPASFNVLPLSVEDMKGVDAPGVRLVVANDPSVNPGMAWGWTMGFINNNNTWILRHDGLVQSSWVKGPDTASTVPGEPSRAPKSNPE